MRIRDATLACFIVAAAATVPVHGETQLLKCKDAAGRVTYSDRGCDAGTDVRQLTVSGYRTVVAAPARGAATAHSTRPPASAPPGAGGAPARSDSVARASRSPAPNPPPLAAANGRGGANEDSAERERQQKMREDYRRDVDRTRGLAAKGSLLGAK